MPGEFVDTNILVYAHDRSAGSKHLKARDLLLRLGHARLGRLSTQVLLELFVVLTRKVRPTLARSQASEIVMDMASWVAKPTEADDVVAALKISDKYDISVWDAMIIRAASAQGVEILWTEDLNDGQLYDGVLVRNPFTNK